MGLAILREPYSGSHAHLPAVAAIGEEALAFAIGAEAAAVDAVHARPFEARACDGVEVQQPVTGTRAAKRGVRSANRRAHFIAHLVDPRPDGGAEPRLDRAGRGHRTDGGF